MYITKFKFSSTALRLTGLHIGLVIGLWGRESRCLFLFGITAHRRSLKSNFRLFEKKIHYLSSMKKKENDINFIPFSSTVTRLIYLSIIRINALIIQIHEEYVIQRLYNYINQQMHQ
jgi:hypothetical protein